MIIVMKNGATQVQIEHVTLVVERLGYKTHLIKGEERSVVGVIGDDRPIDPGNFETIEGVEKVLPVLKPFKLASREMHPLDTVVNIDGLMIGGNEVVIMAGPCSVESRDQLMKTAHTIQEAGATILRGGAFKPRSSPYSFQGLGEQGLELLAEARLETGLKVVTEAMSPEQVLLVAQYADIIQLGARNMQNYELLRAAGKSGRSIERYTRNTTDINAIPVVRELSHLPVILDPSHSTGKWRYVSAVARAGVAAGADGLIVEVHPKPEEALSDGAQSLRPERFADLVEEVREVARAVGRKLVEVQWSSKTPA
jgi:3-deoxy-7-phosphoheptulonate synthase